MTYIPTTHFPINQLSNGQELRFTVASEETTIAAAATTSTTMRIPINAVVMGVSTRVTTIIPTAATFDVGIAGSAALFSSNVGVAAGTIDPGTDGAPYHSQVASAILITPNIAPVAATGKVRVTIHYYYVTPPTS